MPRTCLACASPERVAIDKALANGTPLRDIAGRWGVSRSALDRHKSHVAGAIVKAQEHREERAGENLLDEMKRVQRKAWELLSKTEQNGDHRGSIVALREVRECLESLGQMIDRADEKAHADGPSKMVVEIIHVGAKDTVNAARGNQRPSVSL